MTDNNKKNLPLFMDCGIEFVVRIAVGTAIGILLDKIFQKPPLFLIIFFIFGCIAGYFGLLKCSENYRNNQANE